MKAPIGRALGLGLAALVAASFAPLGGQEEGAPIGYYIVRPGDTLEHLSLRFLGVARQWPELHQLNPRISDPHWIYPGRRIAIPITRPSLLPNAQVVSLVNQVEALPSPIDWIPATPGDLLLESDAVRTHESSSAELLFDDGTSAVVAPESLVFIRRQSRASEPQPIREIEIEIGQAEIAAHPSENAAPEIEVVVGDTRSTTRADSSGGSRSRHRKEGGSAQVMLYEGVGNVQGAGGSVALSRGTGTVIRPGAAPAPPEPLLGAPALVSPPDRFEISTSTRLPDLTWREVEGASGYVVEICADPVCSVLLSRSAKQSGTRFRLPFRPGKLTYWRISAVAPSGLDGYPAKARSIRPRLLVVYN